MNEELLEMMEFYKFYKEMKSLEKNGQLTAKIEGFKEKTEGAISKDGFSNINETKTKPKGKKTEGGTSKTLKKNHKATRPLEQNEYEKIITLCKDGFRYVDLKTGIKKTFRPNKSLALALALQATLGFRGSDIVNLKVIDFKNSKFSIQEIKTGKWQNRYLNEKMYNKLLEFISDNNLKDEDYIYPNKIRNMQQQLKIITDYLGYKNIGTHSFRKLFAHTIYEESSYDIELVRHVLNHSDIKTTMRYLGVSLKKVNQVTSKIDFSYIL